MEEAAVLVPVRRAECARKGELFAEAVGEQAIAADSHEPFRQHMQEEAAEEVDCVEGHDLLLAAVGIIAPAEADAIPVEGGDAVVRDGHAVGVAAEVAQHMFGSAEGKVGVDVPSLVAELVDQLLEARRIKGGTSAVKQALAIEMVKACEELLAKDGAQNGNRQEEHRMAGVHPALVIGRQPAAGNHAVDMVMRQKVRTPRVQDGEESDLCTQTLGIGGDFEQGLGLASNSRSSTGLRDVSARGFSSWGRVKTT